MECAENALAAALRDKAYRLLARREQSACELRRKLLEFLRAPPGKSAPPIFAEAGEEGIAAAVECIDPLLAELAELDAQSDARFAEQLCRARFANGQGPRKLRAELREHRVEDSLIDAALAEYAGRWRELAERERSKKFGESAPASYREWTKQARFLQQRGFGGEEIAPFAR